jgi:hypothetical protein
LRGQNAPHQLVVPAALALGSDSGRGSTEDIHHGVRPQRTCRRFAIREEAHAKVLLRCEDRECVADIRRGGRGPSSATEVRHCHGHRRGDFISGSLACPRVVHKKGGWVGPCTIGSPEGRSDCKQREM